MENCPITKCKDKLCSKRHPKPCKFGEECRFQTSCSYYHPKRFEENEATEVIRLRRDIDNLKAEIEALKEDNEIKLNNLVGVHLKEIEGLQSQNQQTLEEHEVTPFKKFSEDLKMSCEETLEFKKELAKEYADKYKELKDVNIKEVTELKTLNEEIKKKNASSDLLNIALEKKNKELVQEVINIVHKANNQKEKIKIEYDNLVKAISERDTRIAIQEKYIQELKQLLL